MTELSSLSAEDRAWVIDDERRWALAHQIAANYPGVDVDGIYRVLRNLEKPPTERLKAALAHGRLFGSQRR